MEAYLYSKALRISPCGLSASIHQHLSAEFPCFPGWYHQWDPATKRIFYFDPATGRTCWTCPTSSSPAPSDGPHVLGRMDIHRLMRHEAAIVHPLRPRLGVAKPPTSYVIVGDADWLLAPPSTADSDSPQMPYWLCETDSTTHSKKTISVRRYYPVLVLLSQSHH